VERHALLDTPHPKDAPRPVLDDADRGIRLGCARRLKDDSGGRPPQLRIVPVLGTEVQLGGVPRRQASLWQLRQVAVRDEQLVAHRHAASRQHPHARHRPRDRV